MSKIVIPIIIFSVLMMTNVASANIEIFGRTIFCEPSQPVSGTGCGLDDLILAIKYVIEFIQKIVFAVAAIMIIWGGFTIITAGGSEEKVKKGRQIITWAVVGVIITLSAYLVFTALNAIIQESTFKFK